MQDKAFAGAMSGLGLAPEDGPVAVAVSGGADSMALVLLARRWGRVRALTVDHGLRPESAAEAAQVHDWLAARGIDHHILRWEGKKPKHGVQAAAREARYRLMEEWCREHGIDALLLAHHRDDQAETLLLRLARGSGLRGLAAMAPVSPPLTPEDDLPRRYRPLLEVPKSALIDVCRREGQAWIEDPANRDPTHERSRVRALLADPPLPGLTPHRLSATASRLARAGRALDHYVSAHLAACARMDESGYAEIDRARLLDAPDEVVLQSLSRLFAAIGGRAYPPRAARMGRVRAALAVADFRGLTAVGCQLCAAPAGRPLLLCREPAAVAPPLELVPDRLQHWDGRFRVRLAGARGERLGALGEDGWRQCLDRSPALRETAPAHPARLTLPALWSAGGALVAVPHLGIASSDLPLEIVFRPRAAPDFGRHQSLGA